MSQPTPRDPSLLDPRTPAVLENSKRGVLETEVRLATHLRDLAQVSVATSHDIRTPLHTIVLYLELLRRTLTDPESEERRAKQSKYVEVVASELGRLETMLDGLLGQTRLGDAEPQRFDLVQTTQELLFFLEPQGRRFRIQVVLEPATDSVFVRGDKDAIHHALIHLLVVAIGAVSEQEELRVRVSERDGRAVFAIEGPPALETRLRDLSRDGDLEHALLGPQRGLAVARRVVEEHHGTIEVRSGASRATTVEIELPRSAAEE